MKSPAISPDVGLCRIVRVYRHASTTTETMSSFARTLRRRGVLISCPFLSLIVVSRCPRRSSHLCPQPHFRHSCSRFFRRLFLAHVFHVTPDCSDSISLRIIPREGTQGTLKLGHSMPRVFFGMGSSGFSVLQIKLEDEILRQNLFESV